MWRWGVAVLDDKTLRRRIVEIVNRYECECAVCDIIKKPNTQGGHVSSGQMAGARFQRQRRVKLDAGKAGDDDSPVRFAKHGGDSLGAQFRVIKLNECAGVEEVVHRCQNRSWRSAIIASDQELGSLAVILRISS